MQVASSAYLKSVKPLLQALLNGLAERYDECSVLATDTCSKSYGVGSSGVNASQSELYTKRGFVARVRDEKGYAEYSFNHIDEASVPEIIRRIGEQLVPMKDALPMGVDFMERPAAAKESQNFCASSEYEIHPREMGDQAILAHLTRIREAGKAADERILDCMARASWQEIHKLFLSPEKDMEQNLLWTTGALAMLASRGQ